ncbi:MAG TPA: hypothetical protein VL357_01600 [Rariglobus sp.]|nr:hypothetical protein [Rariglobus sp.]
MAAEKPQFKVLCSDETQLRLEDQRKALGFHTNNNLASVYLTALSEIPAEKVWEALAMIRRYKTNLKNPRKSVS